MITFNKTLTSLLLLLSMMLTESYSMKRERSPETTLPQDHRIKVGQPKILMVGAHPDHRSIKDSRRAILLAPEHYDTYFLDGLFKDRNDCRCEVCLGISSGSYNDTSPKFFKGDFNNEIFMNGMDASKHRFDFIIIDNCVIGFMKVKTLQYIIKLLKPTGSLLIQNDTSSAQEFTGEQLAKEAVFHSTQEEFDGACLDYFKKLFSYPEALLGSKPPYLMERTSINVVKKSKEAIDLIFTVSLKFYFEDKLKCTVDNAPLYEMVTDKSIGEAMTNVIIHTIYPGYTLESSLYKITPKN